MALFSTWKQETKLPVIKPPLNFPDLTGWNVWGATYQRAIRQIWGYVEYLLSGSVAVEVLPIRPDSKDLRDFARQRARHLISDSNREPLTESRHHHWWRSNANYSATEKTLTGGVRSYISVTRPRRLKKEKKLKRKLGSNQRSWEWWADTLSTRPTRLAIDESKHMLQEQDLVLLAVLPSLLEYFVRPHNGFPIVLLFRTGVFFCCCFFSAHFNRSTKIEQKYWVFSVHFKRNPNRIVVLDTTFP